MRVLRRDESGFTLIELLTVLSILVIVVTAFTLVLQTTLTRGATITEHATLESEGRAVLDTMAAELRQAACNGTVSPIVTASHTQLTFYTPDRQTPYHMREVSYTLSGGALSEAQDTSSNDSTTGPPWTGLALGPRRPACRLDHEQRRLRVRRSLLAVRERDDRDREQRRPDPERSELGVCSATSTTSPT